jgi:hypothetical protein
MKFDSLQIIIEKEPEDEGYFAYTPTVTVAYCLLPSPSMARPQVRLSSCGGNDMPEQPQQQASHGSSNQSAHSHAEGYVPDDVG